MPTENQVSIKDVIGADVSKDKRRINNRLKKDIIKENLPKVNLKVKKVN